MDTNGAASSGGIERASGNEEALQGLDGDREARTGGVNTLLEYRIFIFTRTYSWQRAHIAARI